MTVTMPDIANQSHAQTEGTLDLVGMGNIEAPLMVAALGQAEQMVSASIDAFVNLKDSKAKGIHMSRLYLLIDELSRTGNLTYQNLLTLLNNFISSHQDLSDRAKIQFAFDYHLRRKSLISGKEGWKAYPIKITGLIDQGKLSIAMDISVRYSSTCPCSAALARQLIQAAFTDKFSDSSKFVNIDDVHQWLGTTDGIVATPHSQRSVAEVKVLLDDSVQDFPLVPLIDAIENSLKTPVQAAVKREDEQEFARLNGQNLMFCEDAARRLKFTLNKEKQYSDFWIKVNHLESLHAHDAICITTKGVSGGFQA